MIELVEYSTIYNTQYIIVLNILINAPYTTDNYCVHVLLKFLLEIAMIKNYDKVYSFYNVKHFDHFKMNAIFN